MDSAHDARNSEIREVMAGVVDFTPTNEEIADALADEPHIAHQAKWWGWRDSEVRSLLASELQRVHEWADELGHQPEGRTPRCAS